MSASVPCQRRRAAAMVRSMMARSWRRAAGRGHVGAVQRKFEHIEPQGFAEPVGGIVARAEMTGGDAAEQLHQHAEFARHDGVEHAVLGVLAAPLRNPACAGAISRHSASSLSRPAGSTSSARDGVEPFIAGGAGDAGKRRHRLAVGEDFLDHHVEWLARAAADAADQLLQAAGVLRRVEQPVDVIEPQTLQLIGGNEPRDQLVHGAKRPRVLDPEAGQLVDVEEAPVVDARHREPPVGEAIVLPLQESMQRADAGLMVGAIGGEPALDDRRRRRRCRRAAASAPAPAA